jgi:6-phosphogluconolactonase (cycloisomerase 2 family)
MITGTFLAVAAAAVPAAAAPHSGGGAVFTLTNQAAGNAVQVYERAADGSLTPRGSVPTGGLGTGAGLGSQGALVLSRGRLLAVDAGSDQITAFDADGTTLRRTAHVASGGVDPISLTVHGNVAYVLNAGSAASAGNITGFRIDGRGRLTPVPGSTRPLSGPAVGPAQVQFSPDGERLVVTEKATNLIDVYSVDDGVASGPTSSPSAAPTPFGFDFDRSGHVIVSDAAGGAPGASGVSSYAISPGGALSALTGFLGAGQTAACWVVTTRNGRYAYATNTGSASISSFAIDRTGALTLLEGAAGTTGAGPIDAALSRSGRYLYALTAGGHGINAFRVTEAGGLVPVPGASGLSAGTVGLAAR